MVRARGYAQIVPSAIERAKARMRALAMRAGKHEVSVGIHDGEGPKVDYTGKPTLATLVEVAMAHEFGLGIPERSFLRSWFDANRRRIEREMAMAERAEYVGNAGAIEGVAKRWESELRRWVTGREAGLESLQSSTVAARDRAGISQETPLFATGQLVEAIRALVDGQSS